MEAVASSISRNAWWSSAGAGRVVARGTASAGIDPDTKRRSERRRSVPGGGGSALRCGASARGAMAELSTATVRHPSAKLRACGTAGGVGADHLKPGPTDPVLEQSIAQVRDRGEQQISDGARRSAVHASYHTSSAQRAARAVENPGIVASIMAKPRRGDVLDLTIDDLAFGGEGVGPGRGLRALRPRRGPGRPGAGQSGRGALALRARR